MRPSKFFTFLFICIFAVAIIIVQSCKKPAVPIPGEVTGQDAIVLNTGDIAADGCGWQIKIADSTYSPTNLGDQFKVDNLNVRISYHKLTTRFYCSQVANNPGPGITEIQIDEIVKR